MSNRALVVALVADGYQELDFWFPLLRMREEEFETTVVATDATSPVVGALGYPVIPDRSFPDVDAECAAVVIPGGAAGRALADDAAVVDWLSRAHAGGAAVAAIGTGSLVIAAAGLASGPVAGATEVREQLERGGATFVPDKVAEAGGVVSAPGTAHLPELTATLLRVVRERQPEGE